MMKCQNVQEKLSAYQDSELESKVQEQVRSHLLNCRACREQYEKLERVWQSLGELQGIPPDPRFYSQLTRKINQPHAKGLLSAIQRVFQVLPSPAVASIILVIGIVLGAYLGNFLVRCDFLPFYRSVASSGGTLINSLRVFDPVPSGTLADGYLRLVSYKENDSR